MFSFGLGICSLIGLVFFPVLYLVLRCIKHFGNWLEREPGPKDRVVAYVILFAAFGFGLGSLAQPQWERLNDCHNLYGSWAQCALPIAKH